MKSELIVPYQPLPNTSRTPSIDEQSIYSFLFIIILGRSIWYSNVSATNFYPYHLRLWLYGKIQNHAGLWQLISRPSPTTWPALHFLEVRHRVSSNLYPNHGRRLHAITLAIHETTSIERFAHLFFYPISAALEQNIFFHQVTIVIIN